MWFGNDLNMPVMIPLIPRVQWYYTQALGSKIFHNDISGLINDQSNRQDNDKLSKNELLQIQEQCKDIPEQVVSMIKSGREFCKH